MEESLKDMNNFGMKAIEDIEEDDDDDLLSEEDSGIIKKSTFKVGQIIISFGCATGSLMLPNELNGRRYVSPMFLQMLGMVQMSFKVTQ